jgi:hypothetical protein
MSVLGDLDGMILREVVNPPLPTKNAELNLAEWDDRVVAMYNAFQDIVSGVNVEAYDPAATYDGTSSDVYEKFVGYNSRIWQAVFAGSFTGQTPAEGIYWTQVTLAQLLPNVLKLAEVATGPIVKLHIEIIPAIDVQSGNSSPITLAIPRLAGQSIGIIGIPIFSVTYGSSAYTSNTVVEVGFDGADVPMFTCDILGRTTSGAKQGIPVTTVGDAQSQVLPDADLVWRVQTGNPPDGDSLATVTVAYCIQ